ncbi:MAG: PLP-dependent aminotransferase family protein [Ruminiclostridium sp.]|nr:PLP-dependent aminotransferase family protein [Ruminiclostridium sp.]
MQIKLDGRSPAYWQIYKAIREKIANRSFVYGDKLPSKRLLARDCGVSISTVEHAYAMLCEEGFCDSRERSGCYVIYDPDSSFPVSVIGDGSADKIAETEPSVSGELPFSPFAAAYRRVILNYGEKILSRSPNKGCIELRTAVSRYLSRCRNIDVSTEKIVVGSGAEYLYGMCAQMLGRDITIALEDPSYEKIRAVYTANGADCEMLRMDSEGIRTDELASSHASVLHVTPFNSFPSGITASEKRRREYLQWAKERGAVIIEDDYDSEFSLTGNAPETLFGMSENGNVIYINTFTNTIAPSLRAGYMLLPDALVPLYSEKIGFYSCTVPMLEQLYIAEWINSGDFERNIGRLRRKKMK